MNSRTSPPETVKGTPATVTPLATNRRSSRPQSALAIDEQLARMHSSSLRIRGVLHLLHEALQSGNGITPKHAAAVCALIESATDDLAIVERSIDTLIDAHLERERR